MFTEMQWHRNEFQSGVGGHRTGAMCRKICYFLALPLHFSGYKSTISRLGERFRNGQYSLVSFFFAVLPLTVSPVPDICKSGRVHVR